MMNWRSYASLTRTKAARTGVAFRLARKPAGLQNFALTFEPDLYPTLVRSRFDNVPS